MTEEIGSTPGILDTYRSLVRAASPRPRGWDGVIGNARAVEMVREAITAGRLQSRAPAHMLLFGAAGTGKSTMSAIIASQIGGGFVSTTASTLETPIDVIKILRQLNEQYEQTGRPSTLFIDEIHCLAAGKSRQAIDVESIFPLLEDWIFPHNQQGREYTAADGKKYTLVNNDYLVWPFTCVGATTDPGMLVQPLLRRFLVSIELEPYTETDIAEIMRGSTERLGWPMDAEATLELAKFSRRNPGRAYQLLTSVRNRALATERSTITVDVVTEVITRMRLYPLGLSDTDVRALIILADRIPRGVGVAELCRALGVSQGQFVQMTEPYLQLLGFVETLSRRVIKRAGLQYLASLRRLENLDRPEVRAMLA